MSRRYKKEKVVMIDLDDRKYIKIIQSEKTTISDHETKLLREQLECRSKEAEDFCRYIVKKDLENQRKISDEEFNNTMKKLLKQHKILKCLLEEQDD